jgi:hypothetical protein
MSRVSGELARLVDAWSSGLSSHQRAVVPANAQLSERLARIGCVR